MSRGRTSGGWLLRYGGCKRDESKEAWCPRTRQQCCASGMNVPAYLGNLVKYTSSECSMVAKLAASDLPVDPAHTTILDALWLKLYLALLRHQEVTGIDVCETDQRLECSKRCLTELSFL